MHPNYPYPYPYNPYPNPNGPNNLDPYYIQPKSGYSFVTKYVPIIEKLMILGPIAVALVLSGITFWDHYRDQQKAYQINQVVQALRLYYLNSSNLEVKRSYPIAISGELNEVDYEYTLRLHLTGKTPLEKHAYILDKDFPRDPWGTYSKDFVNRPVPYRLLPRFPLATGQISYFEGYESCNFRFGDKQFSRCYLYTSTSNGETFTLAYYSEVRKKFVVYTETRNRQGNLSYF